MVDEVLNFAKIAKNLARVDELWQRLRSPKSNLMMLDAFFFKRRSLEAGCCSKDQINHNEPEGWRVVGVM